MARKHSKKTGPVCSSCGCELSFREGHKVTGDENGLHDYDGLCYLCQRTREDKSMRKDTDGTPMTMDDYER